MPGVTVTNGALRISNGKVVSSPVVGIPTPEEHFSTVHAVEAQDARMTHGGVMYFNIRRRFPHVGACSVDWAITPGTAVLNTDYNSSIDGLSGTINFSKITTDTPTDTDGIYQTVALQTLDPGGTPGNRTVTLTLSNASGCSIAVSTATGTIMDGDIQNVGAADNLATIEGYFDAAGAGDCVLFPRGEDFSSLGQMNMHEMGSGLGGNGTATAASPIIIGAQHGAGALPIIHSVLGAVDHTVIQDIHFEGPTADTLYHLAMDDSDDLTVQRCFFDGLQSGTIYPDDANDAAGIGEWKRVRDMTAVCNHMTDSSGIFTSDCRGDFEFAFNLCVGNGMGTGGVGDPWTRHWTLYHATYDATEQGAGSFNINYNWVKGDSIGNNYVGGTQGVKIKSARNTGSKMFRGNVVIVCGRIGVTTGAETNTRHDNMKVDLCHFKNCERPLYQSPQDGPENEGLSADTEVSNCYFEKGQTADLVNIQFCIVSQGTNQTIDIHDCVFVLSNGGHVFSNWQDTGDTTDAVTFDDNEVYNSDGTLPTTGCYMDFNTITDTSGTTTLTAARNLYPLTGNVYKYDGVTYADISDLQVAEPTLETGSTEQDFV